MPVGYAKQFKAKGLITDSSKSNKYKLPYFFKKIAILLMKFKFNKKLNFRIFNICFSKSSTISEI